MELRLSSELARRLDTLLTHKDEVLKESGLLDSLLRELQFQLDSTACPRSQLVASAPQLTAALRLLHSRPPGLLCPPVATELPSELAPPMASTSFTAGGFEALRAAEAPVFSDALVCNGQHWRLKVYPNGNGPARGQHLSAFVELTSGFAGTAR